MFYGAGSVAGILTDAAWDRGVVVTSAYAANAVPVVEYALGMILISLKHAFRLARMVRDKHAYPKNYITPGAYGTTIGLVSVGMIARLLIERLRTFDLKLIAYDPFLGTKEANELGVKQVSMDELFRTSDVVSLHTPLLAETRGTITGAMIDSMKPGATLINTSRGAIIREAEMIDVLTRRHDLQAVLDVADPEPPAAGSALYTLPNIVLTPHIAGSRDAECARMGREMVNELRRFLSGEPVKWAVTRELAAKSSHRPMAR
jgi:phosphoglycerate dehydrogenase-like enzyme